MMKLLSALRRFFARKPLVVTATNLALSDRIDIVAQDEMSFAQLAENYPALHYGDYRWPAN